MTNPALRSAFEKRTAVRIPALIALLIAAGAMLLSGPRAGRLWLLVRGLALGVT